MCNVLQCRQNQIKIKSNNKTERPLFHLNLSTFFICRYRFTAFVLFATSCHSECITTHKQVWLKATKIFLRFFSFIKSSHFNRNMKKAGQIAIQDSMEICIYVYMWLILSWFAKTILTVKNKIKKLKRKQKTQRNVPAEYLPLEWKFVSTLFSPHYLF